MGASGAGVIVMTAEQEQAAQMRTMVWLEALTDIPALDFRTELWVHSSSEVWSAGQTIGRYRLRHHRAIPPDTRIWTCEGFDPLRQNTYVDYVCTWYRE